MSRSEARNRLDDAARAGWLYYICGNTQDEIAAKMGISRQSAQRLVSLAMSERLIKFRLDHPIAGCLAAAGRLKDRFGLSVCEVVPSDPGSTSTTLGIAEAGAAEIERVLRGAEPVVMAVGTGRTLKAAVDQLPPMECPQHRIVSMTGNIAPDGSAAFYNVIFSMADAVRAHHFPMLLPVFAASRAERDMLHGQPTIRHTLDLVAKADVAFVGIGELGPRAPLLVDGFITADELAGFEEKGAAGEICGWVFDADGRLIDDEVSRRNAGAPLPSARRTRVVAIAMGERKRPAIRAALRGGLLSGLITDEATAAAVLAG